MIRTNTNRPEKWKIRLPFGVWWRLLLLLGSAGVGLFLWLTPNDRIPSLAENPGSSVSQPVPQRSQTVSDGRQTPSSSHLKSRPTKQPSLVPRDDRTAEQQKDLLPQPLESVQRTWQLNDLVMQLKGVKEISAEKAKGVRQLLRALRKQGATAVPAIQEFLRQKGDVDFTKIKGGELVGYQTLRQALINTVGQIGGNEALAASSVLLYTTQDPAEIALLAQNLEKGAPGVYRAEIVQVAGSALQFWTGQDQLEVRPLFELLQSIGGVEAAALLEQFPANANTMKYLRNKDTSISPTVRTYALMALAGMPDGEGIPHLIFLAGDPNVPVQNKPELPFQMLAQTAMEYDEAGQALVDLVRAGQIPDRAWGVVGEALQGKYLQFPSQLSGGTLLVGNGIEQSGVEAPFLRAYFDDEKNIKYEQRLVSADWSVGQINRQIALIDKLLGVTTNPTAMQELQQARESLQRSRH